MRKEKILENAVLCFLVKGDKVLLARKAEKIGKDCLNGYGGEINNGESPEDAAVRELSEEALVDISKGALKKMAIADMCNSTSDGQSFICRVHTFIATEWEGEPKETMEMLAPAWFETSNLPFDRMMPADRFWLPQILLGFKVAVRAYLSPFQKDLQGEVNVRYLC